ncbi:unnamed protein product [Spirodela intermedia]|uniref:Uncharacterized protein n=1 Tax=Spirodela intermedia TaxID=51605 RepID=A0A7I8JYI3_SPIIN|nr:unnamed protein product [Spirodela intermedia]
MRNGGPLCPSTTHCASIGLGLVSVLSWGVAEVPQIITNYREKSTEGLSIAFLSTWILGDLFNLAGCWLEPATLPTQFYMALLYTATTLVLTGQTVYYGHVYRWLKTEKSAPPLNTKSMLSVAMSTVLCLGGLSLRHSRGEGANKPSTSKVILVGRKILQQHMSVPSSAEKAGSSGVGTFLGWAMAVIYMGGRLPQICLNMRRGTVEGLSSLMFGFALVGNATYVASILVSSLDWSRISPNLPWLVDAGGCVLLDSFVSFSYVFFTKFMQDRQQGLSILFLSVLICEENIHNNFSDLDSVSILPVPLRQLHDHDVPSASLVFMPDVHPEYQVH